MGVRPPGLLRQYPGVGRDRGSLNWKQIDASERKPLRRHLDVAGIFYAAQFEWRYGAKCRVKPKISPDEARPAAYGPSRMSVDSRTAVPDRIDEDVIDIARQEDNRQILRDLLTSADFEVIEPSPAWSPPCPEPRPRLLLLLLQQAQMVLIDPGMGPAAAQAVAVLGRPRPLVPAEAAENPGDHYRAQPNKECFRPPGWSRPKGSG